MSVSFIKIHDFFSEKNIKKDESAPKYCNIMGDDAFCPDPF